IRLGESERNGVLLIGGSHPDELINPDLLVGLALKLCWAYENDEGLTFGGKTWSVADIRLIVGGVDTFIAPNINPDGRSYVMSDYEHNYNWRKNRSTDDQGSDGTNLNRNFDFVWKEEINASSVPTADDYHGAEPFSEPETRNVRWLLRTYPHITHLADVHSHGEVIIHPWGDANNQSDNPRMNFLNPDWDGLRDQPQYKEYIPRTDETTFIELGEKVNDAIAAARGRNYSVGQSGNTIDYWTSGTCKDYAYSRFFRGPNTKVWAYTFETVADRDAPSFPDAARVIEEVQAGLSQFMLTGLCLVREIGRGFLGPEILDDLADFRDNEMLQRQRGRRWVNLLDRHGDELVRLLAVDRRAREAAEQILVEAAQIVHARGSERPPLIGNALADRIELLANHLERRASPRLRGALRTIRRDAQSVAGKTAVEALD
ncbi:MAG: M14 family zinc carboxypeptidase, partial [Gammaproteobacteria bacterium]